MNVRQPMAPSGGLAIARRLVDHLNSLVGSGDLGALALLRRGLGREPGELPEMFPHVLPYLALDESTSRAQRDREEDAALLIASLYALWHQGKTASRSPDGVSLGTAFYRLKLQADSASIEHRFVVLLKASRDRLPYQLRHAITLLRAKDIPLDWALLFRDVAQWDATDQRGRHPARRRWARDFWERTHETHGPQVVAPLAEIDVDADEADDD